MIKSRYLPVLTLLVGIFVGDQWSTRVALAQAETPKDVIAAQIRIQGIACGKALAARKDAKRSKPDHEVWILKCDNATYRVGRYPDRAAMVVQLH
jgi:hypothetical protein